MRNYSAAIVFLCLALCSLNACKKGCTNPKAGNYNSSAKVDDASCLFCDSVLLDNYDSDGSVEDNEYNSPHRYDYVLHTNVSGTLNSYQGNGCPLLGHVNNCSGFGEADNFAKLTLTLQNQTTDTIIVSGPFELSLSSSETITRTVVNLIIPPFGTAVYPEQFHINCVPSSFAQVFFTGYNLTFQYK